MPLNDGLANLFFNRTTAPVEKSWSKQALSSSSVSTTTDARATSTQRRTSPPYSFATFSSTRSLFFNGPSVADV